MKSSPEWFVPPLKVPKPVTNPFVREEVRAIRWVVDGVPMITYLGIR